MLNFLTYLFSLNVITLLRIVTDFFFFICCFIVLEMKKDCQIYCEAGVDKGQSIFKANQKNVSNLFKVCLGIENC